jgi:gamma-glutamyltranspeptidase/glutathione hydrolase
MALEDRIAPAVREALTERGHKLTVNGPWVLGSMGAIFLDPKTGALSAGADPRVEAYALAW